ncbi:MAG TPA: outer membrane beta-barrel protein [Bacteroidota bacterium]|nr:outer membrane beta-barrel protein [Bacteroidota bacterium]
MKHWCTISMLTLLVCLLSTGTVHAQYMPKAHYIGVSATVVTDPIGWGAQYEYGYDENIGLGLIFRYWGQEPAKAHLQTGSATLDRDTFAPMVQARYHFLPKDQTDPYAGVRLGYSIYTETWKTEGIVTLPKPTDRAESGISLSIIGGMRYFMTNNLSLEACLEYFLANDEFYFENESSTAVSFGVNFTLQ